MTAPSLRALGTVLSSSTTSPSFAEPAGTVADDIIIIAWFQDDARTSISAAPSGFAAPTDAPQNNNPLFGSPSHSLQVYWGRRSAVGAGPYGFTVNVGLGGTPFIEGRSAAVQDCITTGDPFDAADGNTSGLTSVTTAPLVSATSTGTDRFAFYAATNWTGGAWTPPSGYTEQWDADNRIVTFDTLTMAAAATTSPQAVCAGNDQSNAWVGILLPIPAASGASPDPQPLVVPPPALIRASTW